MIRPGRESPGSVQEENHRDRLTGTDREEIQKGNTRKKMTEQKLYFECDYMKGAHPSILNRMVETNRMATIGYGVDEISESARAKIRKACGCENAMVQFLVGGTQTNAVVIDTFLRSALDLFAYERGDQIVLAAGIPEKWMEGEGVAIDGLRTPGGPLAYSLRANTTTVRLDISKGTPPPGGFVFTWKGKETRVTRVPATVELPRQ